MYGAILGDIIGSAEVFKDGIDNKDFPLFNIFQSCATDITNMTLAICKGLLYAKKTDDTKNNIRSSIKKSCTDFGAKLPNINYRNYHGFYIDESYDVMSQFKDGCGSIVSPVSWLYDSLENIHIVSSLIAELFQNTKDGIEETVSVTTLIYLARKGASKLEIMEQANKTIKTISLERGLNAFLYSTSFEDAIRNALMLGGETSKYASIAGSIAEAYYGIPESLVEELNKGYMLSNMEEVLKEFDCRKNELILTI